MLNKKILNKDYINRRDHAKKKNNESSQKQLNRLNNAYSVVESSKNPFNC